jgi:hypothetical protein
MAAAAERSSASAAVIDGCDEVFGAAESEGPATDRFDLVVHALNGSVRKSSFGQTRTPYR